MALTRQDKERLLADYEEKFSKSQALILTDYRGLTVADISNLRAQIRQSGNGFLVVKNTLAKIALERAGKSVSEEALAGPLAIGLCYEDIAPVAKTLNQAAQDTKILQIKGAIVGTTMVGPDQAKKLADLPSRTALLGQVVGTMQAPINGLVNVLAGTIRGLANVLQARANQLEQQSQS